MVGTSIGLNNYSIGLKQASKIVECYYPGKSMPL